MRGPLRGEVADAEWMGGCGDGGLNGRGRRAAPWSQSSARSTSWASPRSSACGGARVFGSIGAREAAVIWQNTFYVVEGRLEEGAVGYGHLADFF